MKQPVSLLAFNHLHIVIDAFHLYAFQAAAQMNSGSKHTQK